MTFRFKKRINVSLIAIVLFAIFLRCLIPLYLAEKKDSYREHMLCSSFATDFMAISIALAKGEGLHTDYWSYAADFKDSRTPKLDNIPRENTGRDFYFDKGGAGHYLIGGALTWLTDSFDIVLIQMFQGVIDSLGCLFVFGIICYFFDKRIGLLGAIVYAVYPAFIFYSYHFMSEAFIPVLMLAVGYTFILALDSEKWFYFCAAGFLIGLSFSFRFDNFLILPCYIFYL